MTKNLRILFLFLTLPTYTLFAQTGDFVQTLQRKLNQYYTANMPVKLDLVFNQPAYAPADTAFFKVSFFTAQENKFIGGRQVINVDLIAADGRIVRHQKVLLNDGWGFNQIVVPPDLPPGIYEVVAYSDWMKNCDPALYSYTALIVSGEQVFKNETSKQIDLYPEGGNFVSGVQNNVVVTGRPLKNITIVDSRKDTITNCLLDSAGLGAFTITPRPREEYHAITGETDKILPLSSDSRVGMIISSPSPGRPINITLEVADSGRVSHSFYFIVSAENKIYYSATLDFRNAKRISIAIPEGVLPAGICMATLFRQDRSVEASRLFEIEKEEPTQILISTDKDEFTTREKVTVNIRVKNNKGNSPKSRMAVSVYSQDLFQGYDNSPLGHLLTNRNPISVNSIHGGLSDVAARQLDHFMITQSWKRFSWDDVWNDVRRNEHTFKANLHFKGKVVMDNMMPSDSIMINFFLNRDVRTYEGDVERDGSFDMSLFFDFEGDDEVFYMVKQNGQIRRDAKLVMDDDHIQNIRFAAYEKTLTPDRYGIFFSTRREIEEAFKTRSIDLIKTKNVNPHALLEDEVYEPDVSINLPDYLIMPTMEETLREIIPLLQHRWRKKSHELRIHLLDPDVMTEDDPLYFIDGVLSDNTDYFMSLKPEDVSSIKVIATQRKLNTFGMIGKNGIVLVETKIPNNASKVPKSAAIFNATGLSGRISFNMKDLDVHNPGRTPYLRSTLYWNPDVRTDENGFASLSFYTADNTGKFRIVVDGTTVTSEDVFAQKQIDVKFDPER